MPEDSKPRVAVFKFASCDGCQLSLLAAEDDLLPICDAVEIVYFLEATSRIESGPYDIALVEGSITTEHDRERIQQIRRDSRFLMTIGACATAGGIQALRNFADTDAMIRTVYASPSYIKTLDTSTAIADHVTVDFELRGCPINKDQLIDVLVSLVQGRQPRTAMHCVCMDCKLRGNVCITVAQGEPCLGPITQSGCGSICPSYDRGCYGCYGPAQQIHAQSLTSHMIASGTAPLRVVQLLRSYNTGAEPLVEASAAVLNGPE